MSDYGNREVLFEGKFRRLVKKDGWEYMERTNCRGVVAILGINDDNRVILVEQFRVPLGKSVIEFPAGLVGDLEGNPEEAFEIGAQREFLEETGYEAGKMTLLARGPVAAASVSEIILLYKAENLKKVSEGGGDETEDITVHEIPFAEVDQWLHDIQTKGERCVDPRVYAGLYFLNQSIMRKELL